MWIRLLFILHLSVVGALKLATSASRAKAPTGESGNALEDEDRHKGTDGTDGTAGKSGTAGKPGVNNGVGKPATKGYKGAAGTAGKPGKPGKKGWACVAEWDTPGDRVCERCAAYAQYFSTTVKSACWNCACDCGIRICGCAHCNNVDFTGTTTTTSNSYWDPTVDLRTCHPCVIVSDESGSMERDADPDSGFKRREVQRFELACIFSSWYLMPQFYVIPFSGKHSIWKSSPRVTFDANVVNAKSFISKYDERGGTFAEPALKAAHDVLKGGRLSTAQIYFFSDGDPDCGELEVHKECNDDDHSDCEGNCKDDDDNNLAIHYIINKLGGSKANGWKAWSDINKAIIPINSLMMRLDDDEDAEALKTFMKLIASTTDGDYAAWTGFERDACHGGHTLK